MSFQVEIDKQIKNGSIYFVGDALPPDWYAAFKTWSLLAEQGDMKSQLNVGWCYLYGEGTEINRKKSNEWLTKSANQNCPKSHWYLSHDYFGADEATRADHFQKAISLGDKLATNHAAELKKKATEEADRKEKQEKYNAIQIENKNKANILEANILKVEKAFNEKKFDAAKTILDKLIEEGFTDFIKLRAAMDITIIKITARQVNVKGNLVSGGVVAGTTQTYQEWLQHIDLAYTAKNKYVSPANISLRYIKIGGDGVGEIFSRTGEIPGNDELSISHTISPKEEMVFLPFFLIEIAKHTFQVPLKGHRRINFPACKRDLKNASCFVLTACYNDESHPTVTSFRKFRENYLAKNNLGKRFIFLYYAYGPKAAEFVKNKPVLKKLLRSFFSGLCRLPFIKNKQIP